MRPEELMSKLLAIADTYFRRNLINAAIIVGYNCMSPVLGFANLPVADSSIHCVSYARGFQWPPKVAKHGTIAASPSPSSATFLTLFVSENPPVKEKARHNLFNRFEVFSQGVPLSRGSTTSWVECKR